ncbi:sugar phosphate isomerase/epimerase family protein [Haloferula sp.]|uniref:sugar phosphate isomerase/epimerase family protein n=1 Tax=Haloferula sp. TaxID=2497595 RepID=UPI003C794281
MNLNLCTWSLLNDPSRISKVMHQATLNGLHLEASAVEILKPLIEENGWQVSATMVAFPQEDYSTLETIKASGGIVPDASWPENRKLALQAIQTTASMKVAYLSTHVGAFDPGNEAAYQRFSSRLRELADAAAEADVMLLLETGQETAIELKSLLLELNHPALGINFDPANMILYGKGDPIEAIRLLAPWIRHVHIKDAIASPVAGEWGQEVPWGDGEVDTEQFFKTLEDVDFEGAFAIEREAGESREEDISRAAERIRLKI